MRRGFTLVEILLVAAIIAIASAVALPAFARSFRGAKLRNSTRLVLMMHRNAHAKAILSQNYIILLFDKRTGTLEIAEQEARESKQDSFFGEVGGNNHGGLRIGSALPGAEAHSEAEPAPPPASLMKRELESGVRMDSFRGGQAMDELYYVIYYPNGMCENYEVVLTDEENRVARIQVDAITGKAKVAHD
ncbi:MAG: prepilin-type N-terminal cleavage/methylation domain-containing protein [Verrucomicrobiota bacterium]|jgi:prepilin-type N-terminal cleavage/methylation domain-containing protein|nr:prepilin-type N-terminal cleavage/methylation domain-containing protein [Verrucomicrobiota bacterium]